MSPYAIVVVLILTVLFFVLSLVPVVTEESDVDSFDSRPKTQPKTAH